MIAYHGSTMEIQRPDVLHSKRNLDFGMGFYVTSNKEQAERWAERKAMRFGGKPTVNLYEIRDYSAYNVKIFEGADEEWLKFVANCRNGADIYKKYDAIAGKVANDDIFKCVNMYMDGYWNVERTLAEIKYYKNYEQTAFVAQNILDSVVVFEKSYEVTR